MKKIFTLYLMFFFISVFSQSVEEDISFGNNGKTVIGFGKSDNNGKIFAEQSDGKIIVGGTFLNFNGNIDISLTRFNDDGSIDEFFGEKSRRAINFLDLNSDVSDIYQISILPNGKILILGSYSQIGSSPNTIILRLNSNGEIDTSFGVNGRVFTNYNIGSNGVKIVVQPDGKFITCLIDMTLGYNVAKFAIERYLEDGVLDTTFGTNGVALASFGTGRSISSYVELQSDGKILVVGNYFQSSTLRIAVSRFTTNGILDNTFDGDGKILTSFGTGTSCEGMHISTNENGKIIVGGFAVANSARNFCLVRYNSNGGLDTTFDSDGLALFAINDDYNLINSISKQSNGKYLVVFKNDNYNLTSSDFVIRRFNSDISIDTSFGNNGKISTTFDSGLNEAKFAKELNNGKLIVVGQSNPLGFGYKDIGISKYNSNGILDTTFDSDGKLNLSYEKSNDIIQKLYILPNDKVVAIGTSKYTDANNTTHGDIIITRINNNGNLDSTFGINGKVVSVFGQNINNVLASTVQNDGKIIVGNVFYTFPELISHYELIRYNSDGTLDATFGTNGKVAVDNNITSIVVQSDGKIYITSYGNLDNITNGFLIYRYNSNGTLDTTFDSDGKVIVSFGDNTNGKTKLIIQPDGKIVLSGVASNSNIFNGSICFATARFTSNGSLDVAFGTSGKVMTLIDDSSFFNGSFLQTDGKIIVTGRSIGTFINFSTVRYNQNGTIDVSYGTNGFTSSYLNWDYSVINDVFMQSDGKFLVLVSKYNENPNIYDYKLRRFNIDGSYDYSFSSFDGIATSFFSSYDEAFSVGLQSDNKIVVAGITFNGYNNDFGLTRFTNNILSSSDFNNFDSNFILFPNPSKDILYIKNTDMNNNLQIIEYSIFDMLGNLIFKNDGSNLEINTNSFAEGIYNIKIKTNKGLVNKKFIKE